MGDLDLSFGTGGKVTTDLNFGYDWIYGTAVQSDGKIMAVGRTGTSGFDFAVVRYNTNGSLDASFGTGGKVVTDLGSSQDYAQGVVLQGDGKIVVAGYTGSGLTHDFAVVRYNPDGSLDTSFGTGGKVITDFGGDDFGRALVLQADGKIVVAGSYDSPGGTADEDFALARYNPDGSLDTTFGSGGKVLTNYNGPSRDMVHALVLQGDGKIVAAGESNQNFALARYNPDGSLDTTFGSGGRATTVFTYRQSVIRGLALQGDGKLVATGDSNGSAGTGDDFALARYNANGTLDTTFGSGGTVLTDFPGPVDVADAVALQPNGKILAAGYTTNGSGYNFGLIRYNPDGSLDFSFGSGGKVTTDFNGNADQAYALVLQGDGKIVAAGYSGNDFALARYLGDTTNTPPSANAGGPYTVAEGGSVRLDGSASSDPNQSSGTLTYAWDLNGNGVYGETGTAATRGDETGSQPTFSAASLDGPGTYTVSLKVTDSAGASSIASATINVVNVAPTVTAPADTTVLTNSTVTRYGSFTDPGPNSPWTGIVGFGDGSGSILTLNPDNTFSFSHVYTAAGNYTATVSITDKDGGTGSSSFVVHVVDTPVTVTAPAPATINEGSAYTAASSFSDPLGSGWTATVDYGDGSGVQALSLNPDQTFTLNHVYAASGNYAVVITVTDSSGAFGTAWARVMVNNVAPTASAGGNQTVNEGSPVTLNGTVLDPGPLDTFTYNWHVVSSNGQVVADGAAASFTFTPVDNGTYTVTFTVTDRDGAVGTDTAIITVNNVAPTVNAGPDGTAFESSPTVAAANPNDFSGTGSFRDPGADTWTATVDYGDGSGVQALAQNGDQTFNLRHTYQQVGVFLVTVTDKDGGVGVGTLHVTVNNLAPVLAGQANQSAGRAYPTTPQPRQLRRRPLRRPLGGGRQLGGRHGPRDLESGGRRHAGVAAPCLRRLRHLHGDHFRHRPLRGDRDGQLPGRGGQSRARGNPQCAARRRPRPGRDLHRQLHRPRPGGRLDGDGGFRRRRRPSAPRSECRPYL
jgi:uncharacterized delta-60 repeat protein